MSGVKQLVIGWDIRLGQQLSLQHIAYMRDGFVRDGHGVYSREDWTNARRAGYDDTGTSAPDLAPDALFLQRAFGVERRKVESGLRLAGWIEQARVASVLEVGCGEMITSWAICSRLPHLQYRATDFDPLIIERCRRVSILAGIDKDVLDIEELRASALRDYSLLVAWDVFYAFSDDRVARFLEKIRASGSTLVMGTSQLVGPIRALSYALKSRLYGYDARCRSGELRAHGFKNSIGHYMTLARQCGLTCELLGGAHPRAEVGDTYCFLKFSGDA